MKDYHDRMVAFVAGWRKANYGSYQDTPVNERAFYNDMVRFLRDPDIDIELDGEGAYFGHQLKVIPHSHYFLVGNDRELFFEIAYSQDQLVIYTGMHNSFWVPEYINLKSGDPLFPLLHRCVERVAAKGAGLGYLIPMIDLGVAFDDPAQPPCPTCEGVGYVSTDIFEAGSGQDRLCPQCESESNEIHVSPI